MAPLTMGRLAKEGGIAAGTLRYSARRGLLEPQRRTDFGSRPYRPDAVRRLRFVRWVQTLGCALDESANLLALSDNSVASAGEVERLTWTRIDDIEQSIRALERMRAARSGLAERCPGPRARTADCPLLATLDGDEA